MANNKTWIIPSDYDDTTTEWIPVIMCIPNTREWRGVVRGAIYNLTRGRNWDKSTGVIIEAQEIGRKILESVTMDCNNSFDRIATALESVDSKLPNLMTLQEFLSLVDDSPILATLAEWVDLATIVDSILPNIDLKLSPIDWIKWFFEFRWKRNIAGSAESIAQSLKIGNFVEGGETVAEGVEAIDGVFDDVSDWASILIQGGILAAQSAQAYAQVRDLYSTPGGDDNDLLRNVNRLYNDVFVDNDISVDIDCCASGAGYTVGGNQAVVPGAGGAGGGPIVDVLPSANSPQDEEKCKNAAFLLTEYVKYTSVSEAVFGIISTVPASGFAVWLNSVPLVFSSLAVAGAVLTLFGYIVGLLVSGLPLAVYMAALKNNLEDALDQTVCDIVDVATTPEQVRTIVAQWITEALPVGLPTSWVDYHIENTFSNSVVNGVFDGYSVMPDGFSYTCNCDNPGACPPFVQSYNGQPLGSMLSVNYDSVSDEYTVRVRSLSAVGSQGGDRQWVGVQLASGGGCVSQWSIKDYSFSVTPNGASPYHLYSMVYSLGYTYSDVTFADLLDLPINPGGYWYVVSDNAIPFTATFVLERVTTP